MRLLRNEHMDGSMYSVLYQSRMSWSKLAAFISWSLAQRLAGAACRCQLQLYNDVTSAWYHERIHTDTVLEMKSSSLTPTIRS